MNDRVIRVLGGGARTISRAAGSFRRDPRSALLMLRMAVCVAVLALLVRAMPLPRVLRVMTPRRRRTLTGDTAAMQARLARLIDLLLAIDVLIFTPICWKRSVVLYRYLLLGGVEARVVFGVRKEGGGLLAGHAWVEADGKPTLEATAPDYAVTYSFPH